MQKLFLGSAFPPAVSGAERTGSRCARTWYSLQSHAPCHAPLDSWESLPIRASELCDLGKGQPRPGPQLLHLCNGCVESRFAILPEGT